MADFSVNAIIRKATSNDDAVHVYGWAAMSVDDLGEPVIDADSDYIPVHELEKAVQDAFLRRGGSGAVGTMHDEYGKADLVESFVLSGEKRAAFGLGDGPQGWMVGLRSVNPEVVKSVRSGAMMELSLRGTGSVERVRVPLGDTKRLLKRGTVDQADGTQTVGVIRDLKLRDVELLSIVDRGASANDRVRSRIVLIKKEGPSMPEPSASPKTRTAQFILAELFEQGKLKGLAPEDKETLLTSLAAVGAMPMAAPAPKPEPEPEPEPTPKAEDETETKADHEEKPMPKAEDNEEMSKREKDLAKQNADLTKRVADLEKAAKRDEIRKMVETDMAGVPGSSVDEVVKVVEEARANLAKEQADQLETILKSASEAVLKSDLVKPIGVRKGGGAGNDNPTAELLELSKSLREKDPSLSRADALTKAGKERPDLWSEYQNQRGRK